MGNIYVARQPIFNNRMKLSGYELFYRRSERNLFEGSDDDQATASVLADSFFMGFDELIDGTRGFINFSQNLLLSETPLLLPPNKVVIEIVERTEITPELVAACKRLKKAGYKLALDNFTDDETYRPLLELADIIKVDYSAMPLIQQALMIRKYRPITFAAMKVETADEFRQACILGYTLFQGYFFNRPVMIGGREIGTLGGSMVQTTHKLSAQDPSLKQIAEIIERDVEMSYQLLRIANSAFYRSRVPITSIQHALMQIGLVELRRWCHLLLIKGLTNPDNTELIKLSLIRGRMMALFAIETNKKRAESDYFITGMFSSIDDLLGEPMDKVLSRLPLTEPVKAALLGEPGPLRAALNAVLAFERTDWDAVDKFLGESGLPEDTFTPIYLDALKWQQALDV